MSATARKYRSKPTEIEAVHWTGTMDSWNEISQFTEKARADDVDVIVELLAGKDGAQGWVPVPIGHWIVRNPGDDSDYWPVDPDFFARKYEAAE